jgi:hypothetical protein
MYFGIRGMKKNYAQQMKRLFDSCKSEVPWLIGETGIPMDMNKYFHSARDINPATMEFEMQTQALDCVITACERNLLPYCLWNYTPENVEGKGDFWNREDLSIFSLQHCDGSRYAARLPAMVFCDSLLGTAARGRCARSYGRAQSK